MAISFLQQEAFLNSRDFNLQVDGLVRKQAQYWWQFVPANDPQRDNLRVQYSQVTNQPANYGFVGAIVSDNNWNTTYDPWSADPASINSLLETAIQTWWYLLTGITPPTVTE